MEFKVHLLMCFLLALVFMPDAEGCVPVCKLKCGWFGCTLECGLDCSFSIGKIDVTDELQHETVKRSRYTYITLPLPYAFAEYDENKDGLISFQEFKSTLPPVKDTSEIEKGFKINDSNGDSHIDCEEFLRAKVEFGNHKPVC